MRSKQKVKYRYSIQKAKRPVHSASIPPIPLGA